MEAERRYARIPVEVRSTRAGAVLAGYAAAYNRLSQNLGGFVEQVHPGAFAKSLADGTDVVARFNHSDDWLLGRTSSGTLRLADDATGLAYEIDLPDTSAGRDVRALAARGDLRQSSFAFHAIEDEWGVSKDFGYPMRTLKSVRLLDVAPVVSPAYLDTTASLRSLAQRAGTDLDTVAELAARNELRDLILDTTSRPTVDPESQPEPAPDLDPGPAEAQPGSVALRRLSLQLIARR